MKTPTTKVLNAACLHQSDALLMGIIKQGYTVEKHIDQFDTTLLHLIAKSGKYKVLDYAIRNQHPNINLQNKWGYTPLHFAAKFNNPISIMVLLENKARPAIINCNGDTPLHLAAGSGHYASTKVIYNHSPYLIKQYNKQHFKPPDLCEFGLKKSLPSKKPDYKKLSYFLMLHYQ